MGGENNAGFQTERVVCVRRYGGGWTDERGVGTLIRC